MTSLLEHIKKTVEETYDTVRGSASDVIEKAEDFGKISKIRFDLRQLSNNVEKKLTILGDAVLSHLIKNDVEALKDNPAIKLVVEEIQDLNKKIDDKQKEIDKIVSESQKITKEKEVEKLHTRIEVLEKEIEERMSELKKLKGSDR
jgi:gas vesicle protein